MKEWIPLLQSLIWPAFLGILIYKFRGGFEEILSAIKRRIDEGSEVGVGPGGFTLGSAPQLPDDPKPEDMIDDGAEEADQEFVARERDIESRIKDDPAERLQLIHTTRFLRVKNGRDYYRVIVSLDPSGRDALAKVEKVVYYLHKSFRNPVREIDDRETNFALKTAAWGEFTVRADVFLKGRKEPVRLSRYLNIQARR